MSNHASPKPGPLAWMAQNSVAANLVMLIFIFGGLIMVRQVKQEVFPEVTLDIVRITVAYPGASPQEVEQGTILAIEEAVRSVDGIKEVTATANEGSATVSAELLLGTESEKALDDIKANVDRITSFPADIEQPRVSLINNRRQVLSLVLAGELTESALKQLAEKVRQDLLASGEITVVEVTGIRPPEIQIEVPQENLRRYGLTLRDVASAVGQASVELPGGGIKTNSGEVLLRTDERREVGQEFQDITVLSRPDGTEVKVDDLGAVVDGFQETDDFLLYNGRRAVRLEVFRIGEQTPIDVSDAVKSYLEKNKQNLPLGVDAVIWNDRSDSYRDRVDLLLRNALQGLILVLLVLGIFLEIRLAFWVTLGIPISFVGALLFMPALSVSLNMISLFAFILTLGIVVDDAIVVGEAIYNQRQQGKETLQAAVDGVREVAGPVTFSVLTTVMAFTPLLFVPGTLGKFFRVIPLIVIPILLISLVESLLILPAHLSHEPKRREKGILATIARGQQKVARGLERFVERVYKPVLNVLLDYRYVTCAAFISMLILAIGTIGGGLIRFTFFPKIEGNTVTVNVELPFGAPANKTEAVMRLVEQEAQDVFAKLGDQKAHGRGILAKMGSLGRGGGPNPSVAAGGSHVANVEVLLVPAADRPFTTREFVQAWRKEVKKPAGVESITFNFDIGPSSGSGVDIKLSHQNMDALEGAASRLAKSLEAFDGVFDINDGFAQGKEQLNFKIKPQARTLGVTSTFLGRQVRDAFFGAEALRQQRQRDELRVYVRRPLRERASEYDIEQLVIRTPQGGEMLLSQAAQIVRGRSYTSITRVDGQRTVRVTADIASSGSEDDINNEIRQNILPELIASTPGLSWDEAGKQQDRKESLGALGRGFILAMLAIFALLAIAFRSYVQPLIVLCSIPFGIVGAMIGHLVMGYNLSFVSALGIVALSGVVVNDSLVLVDAINTYRKKQDVTLREAVVMGGVRRFRPILLTTLTTFFGLMPMILETSVQARFLVPMAISLGVGILFVTFIALILVPTLYLVIEDMQRIWKGIKNLYA